MNNFLNYVKNWLQNLTKTPLKDNFAFKALITLIAGFLVFCLCLYLYNRFNPANPVIMSQDSITNPAKLTDTLNIPKTAAKDVADRIIYIQSNNVPPDYSYSVTAPTIESAADIVAKNPPTEKSDKTVVVPNTDKQTVDVYKINLQKKNNIKVGATLIDGKAYATAGIQINKVEILAHSDGTKLSGGTVLYKVTEW